jgi:Holliday junction resolvasome RuvABC endonuclease subunit
VTNGAEFLGALKATVACWCEEHNVPCQGVSSSTLKQYATGKAVANKEDMICAANLALGTNFDPKTYERTGADNMADAAFLCKLGVQLYSEGLNHDRADRSTDAGGDTGDGSTADGATGASPAPG